MGWTLFSFVSCPSRHGWHFGNMVEYKKNPEQTSHIDLLRSIGIVYCFCVYVDAVEMGQTMSTVLVSVMTNSAKISIYFPRSPIFNYTFIVFPFQIMLWNCCIDSDGRQNYGTQKTDKISIHREIYYLSLHFIYMQKSRAKIAPNCSIYY